MTGTARGEGLGGFLSRGLGGLLDFHRPGLRKPAYLVAERRKPIQHPASCRVALPDCARSPGMPGQTRYSGGRPHLIAPQSREKNARDPGRPISCPIGLQGPLPYSGRIVFRIAIRLAPLIASLLTSSANCKGRTNSRPLWWSKTGPVAAGRLNIVIAFDVGEQVPSGLVPGRPSSLVDEFDLEGVEEAFHRGVVVAAAGSAHGRCRLHVGKLRSVGLGGVWAAAIRGTDEPRGRSLPSGRHHQGDRCQLGPLLGRRAPCASGRVHAADGRSRPPDRTAMTPGSSARFLAIPLAAVAGSRPSAPCATASASTVGSRVRRRSASAAGRCFPAAPPPRV